MTVKTILLCFWMAPLFVLASPAYSDAITFQFSGSVTQVPVDDVFGDIGLGETFHGTLSFDSAAVDQLPGDPTIGSYSFSSPFGMTVSVGAHDFEASGFLNIEVLNSFVDQYTVSATSGTGDLNLQMFLLDNTGSAFADDHLPLNSLPLAGFAERDFQLDGLFGGGEIQLDGEIGAPSTEAVPEPSSIILLATALIAIFSIAYRRHRPVEK